MIWSSWPWKREIARRAASLERRRSQRRWSALSTAALERDVFIATYAVRKLMETQKISDEVERISVRGRAYAPAGRSVDFRNWDRVEELYDLSVQTRVDLRLRSLCNQFIHSFIFLPSMDEAGGLQGLFVASEREKEQRLLHFGIDGVIDAFRRVAEDDIVYTHYARKDVGTHLRVITKSNVILDDPIH